MSVQSKVLECECGHVVTEVDEQAFVAAVQRHGREAHGMNFSREQVLALGATKVLEEGGTRDASEDSLQPESVGD